MKTIFYWSVLAFIISCSAPASRNTLIFRKDDYLGKWSFSVNKIEVYCSGYKEIYCTADNGKTYALNGSAKGASHNISSISKVEEIWLDDPNWAGLKLSYGDFITEDYSYVRLNRKT